MFTASHVAVFVDGCFWHGCPEHGTIPRTNQVLWEAKIRANQLRDEETNSILKAGGWMPIRVWEHQPAEEAADVVEAAVRASLSHVAGGTYVGD